MVKRRHLERLEQFISVFARSIPGVVFTLISMVATAEESMTFRWQRGLTLPEIGSTSLASVPLDSDFYEATRDDWPDVRLRDANSGAPVAFVIRRSYALSTQTMRQSWMARQVAARVDAVAGLQMELDVDSNQPLPSEIQIVTPLRDFEHQVQLETSADGQTWISAGPPTLIFDYSQYVDARSVRVPIDNPSQHRRFRLTVADTTADQESQLLELHRRLRGIDEVDRTQITAINRRPFRVDRIEFYRDDAPVDRRIPQPMPVPDVNLRVAEDDEQKQTIVSFETRREPIVEIQVETESENFSRTVRVETEQLDGQNQAIWHVLATGTLTRFVMGSLQQEELKVAIPESRAKKFRLIIENRDSPPLSVAGVSLTGAQYELTFLASPNQKLKCEYGSPTVQAGDYDTAALKIAMGNPDVTSLSAIWESPTENQAAPMAVSPTWQPWNDRRFLVGGILVFTLILGWGLFRASRMLG